MKSPSRGTIRSWPVRPGKYARANMSRNRCRAAREAALGDAACRIPNALFPADRLTSWLDADQAVAARIRVMRTGKAARFVMSPPQRPHPLCPPTSRSSLARTKALWRFRELRKAELAKFFLQRRRQPRPHHFENGIRRIVVVVMKIDTLNHIQAQLLRAGGRALAKGGHA